MIHYHESRAWDKARSRMRAPILVGWFLGNGNSKPARHVGPVCPRCGGRSWAGGPASAGPAPSARGPGDMTSPPAVWPNGRGDFRPSSLSRQGRGQLNMADS